MFRELLFVGLGGFLGSIFRFLISRYIILYMPVFFVPLGTLTVNVLGSFLIGIFASIISDNILYFIAIVGFCGGFTTFSTFSLELIDMLKLGEWRSAMVYVFVSLVLCTSVAALGFWIGERYIMNRV